MDGEDLKYLRDLAAAVIEASSVRPGQRVGASPVNTTGGTLVRPGGRACYPSFWIRDFSLSADCGLLDRRLILHALDLIGRCQNGPAFRRMATGALVPPWAVPDHINFDGKPVFFPGTYESGDRQGGEPWGLAPPLDNYFEFVHLAWLACAKDDASVLRKRSIAGVSLLERLVRAFEAVETDPHTGLVSVTPERRAVGFGFCDTVYLTGELLFPSLLRWRAARELAALLDACEADGRAYLDVAGQIARHLPGAFAAQDGWLLAATGVGRQPDVWGTARAVQLGLLSRKVEQAARKALIRAVRAGTICQEGAVRHLPTDCDHGPDSAWERVCCAKGQYQNGGYWHTPTGWLLAAIAPADPELARSILRDFIEHLRREDFRRGPDHGAPWEWVNRDTGVARNAVYLTSVTAPLAAIEALMSGTPAAGPTYNPAAACSLPEPLARMFPPARRMHLRAETTTVFAHAVSIESVNGAIPGFEVEITPEHVHVRAQSQWHARFALRCLSKLEGRRVPCGSFACWPELSHRGIQLDLGRVIERPDTVKRLLERYADLGYNVLQLYLEDALVFASHPRLARPFAWTMEQARDVAEHALRLGISVIPAIQSLGHCHWITARAEYAELDEMHRADGRPAVGVLCPSHPRTLPMLEAMIWDVAPLATAGIIHLGMDESFHIGQCEQCAPRRRERGEGGIFVDHANRLIAAVKRAGKRAAMWGDMFYYHPDQVAHLDRSVLIQDWYYYAFETLPRVELFNFAEVDSQAWWKANGIESWGCPASIYTAMLPTNDPRESLANARSWLSYLKRAGADGMMVTQWEMSWTSVDLGLPTEAAIARLLWGTGGREGSDEELLADACAQVAGDRSLAPLMLELGRRRMHGYGMRRMIFCDTPAAWISYEPPGPDAQVAADCDAIAEQLEQRAPVFATAARWLAYQYRKRSVVNALALSQHIDTTSLRKLAEEAKGLASRWKRHWDENRFDGDQRNSMVPRLERDAEWLSGDARWLGCAVLVLTVRNTRPGLPRLRVQTSSDGKQFVDGCAFNILEFDSRAARPFCDRVLRFPIPLELPRAVARARITAEGAGACTLLDIALYQGGRCWRFDTSRPMPCQIGCGDPKALFYQALERGDSSQVFTATHETIEAIRQSD